jgi:hypothetical protein
MKIVVLSLLALLALANIFMFALPQGQKAQIIYTDITHQEKIISIALKDGKILFIGNPEHTYSLIDKETKIEKLTGYQLLNPQIAINQAANFELRSENHQIEFFNGVKKTSKSPSIK